MSLITSIIFAALIPAQPMTLNVKSEAVKISFIADMQDTEGSIGGFQATINFDPENLAASSIEGTVDVNTLETGVVKRDDHLKSADYFEAETYPTMSFKSSSFVSDGNGFVMTGQMRIKDTEHEEKIIFTYADNLFKANCTIQASNYNFGYQDKKKEKTDVRISFHIPIM